MRVAGPTMLTLKGMHYVMLLELLEQEVIWTAVHGRMSIYLTVTILYIKYLVLQESPDP